MSRGCPLTAENSEQGYTLRQRPPGAHRRVRPGACPLPGRASPDTKPCPQEQRELGIRREDTRAEGELLPAHFIVMAPPNRLPLGFPVWTAPCPGGVQLPLGGYPSAAFGPTPSCSHRTDLELYPKVRLVLQTLPDPHGCSE